MRLCDRFWIRLATLFVLLGSTHGCHAQQFIFEVASVRPDANPQHGEYLNLAASGRFSAGHITVGHLLLFAYGLRGNQVLGGPAWLRSETYEINAKLTDIDVQRIDQLDGKGRFNAYREMVRNLLLERFHLKVVQEMGTVRGYVLEVADSGSKLTPAKGEFGAYVHPGTLSCKMCTLESLVSVVAETVDAPVIDNTALSGLYDFTLEWDEMKTTAEQEMAGDAASVKPSMREALSDQLGLKLISRGVSVPTIEIEEVSRPEAN